MANLKAALADVLETKFILNGQAPIEGFDVELINLGAGAAGSFREMVTTIPYDIGQLPLTNYIIARDLGISVIALPVATNYFYPVTGLLVSRQSGIDSPAKVAGKRIGVPLGFASNPAVWLRGILNHQFDISSESITWVEGERDSLADLSYVRSNRYKIDKRQGLMDLLEKGEIDGMVVGGADATETAGVTKVVQEPYPLLDDYVRSTAVFPINTLLVLKESSVKAHPGLVPAVMDAFHRASDMYHRAEPDDGLHLGLRVGQLRRMGLFPYKHGIETNRKAVRMMVQYLYEQGLIRSHFEPEELFAAV